MSHLPALLAAATLVLTSTSMASAVVDLDEPNALSNLRRQRPDDFGKVTHILRDAERLPQRDAANYLHAAYGADSVRLEALLLVSYPAKRRLSFSLGDADYKATVVVDSVPSLIRVK